MKTNSLETDWIAHYFKNTAIANVGDATGLPASGPTGSEYIGTKTGGGAYFRRR